MAKSLFEELGGKYETGNRHLGATAFRLSKTVP